MAVATLTFPLEVGHLVLSRRQLSTPATFFSICAHLVASHLRCMAWVFSHQRIYHLLAELARSLSLASMAEQVEASHLPAMASSLALALASFALTFVVMASSLVVRMATVSNRDSSLLALTRLSAVAQLFDPDIKSEPLLLPESEFFTAH